MRDSDSDIRIVCFDLGGVLVRIWRTWPDICRAAGLPLREGWDRPEVRRVHDEHIHLYSTGAIGHEEWSTRLSDALGGVYSPGELDRLHHAVTRTEYDGVGALIDELHARGVLTACLSNTAHAHWVRLVHRDGERDLPGAPEYPTVRKLQAHYASHLLGLVKPDPAIYLAFERGSQRTGGEILFFDDLAANIAAAQARGWRAEHVDHREETAPQIRRALTAHGLL
jgi:FMN phosphatase YigB (HAD superfamily)